MGLSIRSGPATVLAAGTVTAFEGHPIVLAWEDGPLRTVTELRFATDPAVADVAVATEQLGDRLVLHLTNFDGPDGRGTGVPLQVAEHPSGSLFLHFKVFRYGRTRDRSVQYTLYLVPAASEGVLG